MLLCGFDPWFSDDRQFFQRVMDGFPLSQEAFEGWDFGYIATFIPNTGKL
jgi:hypothetical protein